MSTLCEVIYRREPLYRFLSSALCGGGIEVLYKKTSSYRYNYVVRPRWENASASVPEWEEHGLAGAVPSNWETRSGRSESTFLVKNTITLIYSAPLYMSSQEMRDTSHEGVYAFASNKDTH